MNARVVGVSVDHVPALTAWAESLGDITFPLLSDFWPHGQAASEWGVFREQDGHSERAIFIVDSDGIVRYVDVHDIADQPDNDVLFAELEKLSAPESAVPSTRSEQPSADTVRPGAPSTPSSASAGLTLTMYCRSWCPDCRRARAWLEEHGVEFTEIDVDTDAEARSLAASLNDGNLHTPTFVIGEGVCVDFKPDRIKELLDMP